jgi:hypothetical protein
VRRAGDIPPEYRGRKHRAGWPRSASEHSEAPAHEAKPAAAPRERAAPALGAGPALAVARCRS